MKAYLHYRKYLALLGVLIAISSHAEIYRWVDDKGQVHFGDKPGNTDHELIEQDEDDFSTIGTPPKPDNTKVNSSEKNGDENRKEDVTSEDNVSDDEVSDEKVSGAKDKPVVSDDENLSEQEKQRLKRIEAMEALAEELRIAREKRESKREKEKKELQALRKGCARAEERIKVLQQQINHYIASQDRRDSGQRQEEVTLDSKRQRMDAELKSRQQYVNENCNNL